MNQRRIQLVAVMLFVACCAGGCSEPAYDRSTPEKAIDALHQMILDERADLVATLVYIEPREEMVFEEGVTEASAIEDVRAKAGDMLAQLFRVAKKLRDRFPDESAEELNVAARGGDAMGIGPWIAQFLTNPFGLLEEQKQRLSAVDLGDGTAALQIDGEPHAFLTLIEVDGQWHINLPVSMLNEYRPNTRHEWAVVASMMLSIENALSDFEHELDDDAFRSLAHAGERAGRMLGESVVVQGLIYRMMKRNADGEETE